MSQPVILPPISITKGVEFYAGFEFLDSQKAPVSMVGWTGTFKLSLRPFEDPFYEQAVEIDAENGFIEVTIPPELIADKLDDAIKPVIGGSPSTSYQIQLIAPDPYDNQVWQGTANIAGVF